ncbi:MAG: hypothetical protein HeimC3_49670 [Candidatus Heimdallarchaeota archaeon LC_3]|nr:MAG: hypothetical protein HeimC3_49670 [Candidatus Heimdallarchaeota archaeon LC_3]
MDSKLVDIKELSIFQSNNEFFNKIIWSYNSKIYNNPHLLRINVIIGIFFNIIINLGLILSIAGFLVITGTLIPLDIKTTGIEEIYIITMISILFFLIYIPYTIIKWNESIKIYYFLPIGILVGLIGIILSIPSGFYIGYSILKDLSKSSEDLSLLLDPFSNLYLILLLVGLLIIFFIPEMRKRHSYYIKVQKETKTIFILGKTLPLFISFILMLGFSIILWNLSPNEFFLVFYYSFPTYLFVNYFFNLMKKEVKNIELNQFFNILRKFRIIEQKEIIVRIDKKSSPISIWIANYRFFEIKFIILLCLSLFYQTITYFLAFNGSLFDEDFYNNYIEIIVFVFILFIFPLSVIIIFIANYIIDPVLMYKKLHFLILGKDVEIITKKRVIIFLSLFLPFIPQLILKLILG